MKAGVVREDAQLTGKPMILDFLLNVNGVRSTTYLKPSQPQPLQQQQQQQQLLPKQPVLPYRSPLGISNGGHSDSPIIRGGIGRVYDSGMNNNLVQSATLQGMVDLGSGIGGVAMGSAVISSDGACEE
ncbi:Hypothetical predicted protein [Olea europaea subsp. europaea]|uniref:Uncharacterized protein n=1 Tax=Olea europaea subsp. europaea TaxID=158383 RepID=A0A8S0RMU7_OLEEU|nr:Hypothetical predicted protein [Olea europaea subsp. europaea]